LLDRDAAQAVAGERSVVGIESRESRHALPLAGSRHRDGNIRNEQVLVIEHARIEEDLAAIPLVRQRASELAAVVRGKLRVAHAFRIPVEAAEADEPVLGQGAAVEAIDPIAVVGTYRQADVTMRVRRALT